MSIQGIIKQIQDIMRQDAGVDGDAQRLSQLVWMLFLKIFDDKEREYELVDPKYKSPLPENLRYRNWATDPEGMTGDDLLDFINNTLFKKLKSLSFTEQDDPRGFIVREVFEDAYNYMKSGTLIRQVINKINSINFNDKDDKHHFNEIYEHLLKELQSAGNAGEYYTPRPLTKFVVEMVDPKLGEIVLDPACGTGGFLINAIEHIRATEGKALTAKDEKKLQTSIRGTELKPLPHLLAITNMILHGVETPQQVKRGDMLARSLRDYGPKDRVDVILANPPFGGTVADGTQANFPVEFRTKSTELLFLVLFVHLLKPGGRAGIVLPDGTLFGEGISAKVREKLLTECNVHTIVRLPPGVFQPYAGVNTNLIFFEKGHPTKEIWYYQMWLPEGKKQYSKGNPIKDEDFATVKEWWNKRKGSDFAWKVSIDDIKAKNWNLDFKNPNDGEMEEELGSKELIKKILKNEKEIEKLLFVIENK